MAQVVLITGCSSGIGRDLVQRLSQSGYAVVATARKVEMLDDLPAALKLPLDVTKDDSVCRAVEHTFQQLGRIDVLINNAAYAMRGAIEEIPVEQTQQLFDVNVFGVLRMIRAVVPLMRQQKAGRIINIGSIGGRRAVPVNGMYSASKFALEGLNDALRLEVASFGIQVVLVEPGPIKTHFGATAQAHGQAIVSNAASPYQALYRRSLQVETSYRRSEPGPEVVSRVVQQAMEATRPRTRYLPGVSFTNRLILLLGDRAKDLIFKRLFMLTAAR